MTIQRWDMFAEVGINQPVKYDMWEAVEGRYVLYADHVAAIAAAEARVRRELMRGMLTSDTEFQLGVQAARDAVKTECLSHHGYTPGQTCPYCTDALAAIDGVKP